MYKMYRSITRLIKQLNILLYKSAIITLLAGCASSSNSVKEYSSSDLLENQESVLYMNMYILEQTGETYPVESVWVNEETREEVTFKASDKYIDLAPGTYSLKSFSMPDRPHRKEYYMYGLERDILKISVEKGKLVYPGEIALDLSKGDTVAGTAKYVDHYSKFYRQVSRDNPELVDMIQKSPVKISREHK